MGVRATSHAVPDEGQVELRCMPWLTSRRLTLFVIGWLLLFAIGSIFVSNPFEAETSASATPDYARVMYLHGLLVGMVGLLALLACRILSIRSGRVQAWIVGSVAVATVFSGLGGLWDRTIPGPALPLWFHLIGLFALDMILVTLLVGMVGGWRGSGALPLLASAVAVVAMEVAALMGHLAGWVMQYGWKFPPVIARYAQAVGFGKQDDFTGALMGSHSHELTVGAMALAITLAAQQFGYSRLKGIARGVIQAGLAMVAAGAALMTVMYLVMGLTPWSPPTFFTSGPKGVNGIAGDDMVTGILVMGGGLVVVAALVLGGLGGSDRAFLRPIRLAAVWAWVVSFATVVVAGYAIEMHEAYFGGPGDPKAAGAARDAVFTWYHQDIGLFLLPTIVAVMLAVERLRLVDRVSSLWIGGATLVGITLIFLGGLIWVVVNPSLFGPGYAVATVGLAVLGCALLAVLWRGVFARAGRADAEGHLAA